ncbi:microcin C transport system substrate-binding protein [Haloferula luteola]|uniref:Microcin C transport system substrate-binding protein n=1 Tax=Haloferula luteola TaxID=595692 RepID=A0A840UWU2_9BACT|nr:extracellular solute-binding protein [Haloferula luteola]MBB5350195.1 microcin C transport system substrate-binding protein [Haloferula luteola]
MIRKFVSISLLAVVPWLTQCREAREFPAYDNTAEREAFYQRYNRDVREKLDQRKQELEQAIAADPSDADSQRDLGDLERRLQRPDYFEELSEADLPEGLQWEDGMDQPELGSEQAKKGGTLHTYIQGNAFPPTIRVVGKEANNSFRAFHWDDVEMALVTLHPNTGEIIPGLADRWAVAEDGQTVYYHIDDDARWSDGKEVTSADFLMTYYVALSPYLTEPYYRIYYGDQFWGIATYGKDYVCIRNAFPKPMAAYFAAATPYQEEFYRQFGPDFEERYNWRPRPTTGAYQIRKEDILKGRSISLSRVQDWWAKDRKYYKNRFNVDRIEYRLVRDEEKIFQMFLRGDIDIYWLNDAKRWYEQTEVDPVFKGYIERVTFYNDYPRPSRGLYFNLARPPLDNLDVRMGLSHATNWDKVINLDLRGDAERLNLLNEGFGEISPKDVKAREFSVAKALDAFARAGYSKRGKDGILRNDRGERLSFPITYVKHPAIDPMMLRLKEEAKKAGVEFKLEGLDATAAFQKTSRKEHEIAFAGWAITPPFPDYFQQFHSKEAFLEDGKTPRPMTNNLSSFADKEVDKILEENRNARSLETVIRTSHELERIFHDRAVWVPAYQRPFYRVGYWRWLRWPEDFNVKIANEPEVSHVFWIDSEIKQETLEAMRSGRSFGEVNRVYDQYRIFQQPEAIEPEVEPVAPEPAVAPENSDDDMQEEGGGDE